jgi:hypothetical protein
LRALDLGTVEGKIIKRDVRGKEEGEKKREKKKGKRGRIKRQRK